jgi:Tol biopolymer transport system component
MWGCWASVGQQTPREVFRGVAASGATVFADIWQYNEANARLAKEFGLKYFACSHLHHLTWPAGGRTWVNEEGKEVEKYAGGTGQLHRCPLDEFVYRRWLMDDERMKGLREGLVDGLHVDWESTEAGICYCDDCFVTFLALKGIKEALPERAKRFQFSKDRGLEKAYEDTFHQRRVEMFTRIRKQVQAVNPDFLFSSYNMLVSDFTRGLHTPQAPFIILDARHYYNDDRQPWWESYSQRLRAEGYLYIAGGWDNALFGSQATQVSAAQWIYEASINEDGCWLWFEHELTNDMLRAYSSADQRIRTVQDRVGAFLFNGRRDPVFVTTTEWSGNPDLEQAVVSCTYHLGDGHLTQVSNVNTEWPLRARIRFPRLAADAQWTVRDALSEQYYSSDGASVVWSSAALLAGVVVALEPRSDLFVLVSPATGSLQVAATQRLYSRDFEVHPAYTEAAAKAGAVKGSGFALPKDGWQFRMDKGDVGVKAEWYLPSASLDGWVPIEIESFWGGKGDVGAGWYRRDVESPALPAGRPIYLRFGGADEELMLWIDGVFVGEHNEGPVGWDKPFALDATGKLSAGKHHLAMRVYNSAAAGGVWKPISMADSPNADAAGLAAAAGGSGPGRLVYTATEALATNQTAFAGGCGVGTLIGNTIRTINADGTGQVRLRQLHGELWTPRYSPDGRKIAFVHDTQGRGQICLMNADGSDVVNLSSVGVSGTGVAETPSCDRWPVWSPDGSKIAFLSDRNGDWDLHVMNADGTGQRRLAGNPGLDRAPAWSPDGRRLAWESHGSGLPSIWLCDADGTNSHPLIAPDKPFRVREARPAEKPPAIADIPPMFPDNSFYLTDPVWSADGKRLACSGLSGGTMVAVLEADGSGMLQVIPSIPGAANVAWSPDGSQLAGTLRTAPGESERSGLFVVKADGTADYRWLMDITPQGPRLGGAYRAGLMTWYSSGSAQPRRVVKTFQSLRWSPDGKTLAFSSDLDPSGAFYVYTIASEGGSPSRLDSTQSAWPNEIMWTPR